MCVWQIFSIVFAAVFSFSNLCNVQCCEWTTLAFISACQTSNLIFLKKHSFNGTMKNVYTAKSMTEAKATRFIEIIGYRRIRYSIIERLYTLLDIKIHFYYCEYISRNLFARFLRHLCLKSKLFATTIDNFYFPDRAEKKITI